MVVASDTEIEAANAPPSGVIVGVLTVIFLELVAVVVALSVLVDTVLAVETVLVVVSAFDD